MLNTRRRMVCCRCNRHIPRKSSFVTQTFLIGGGECLVLHTCLECMEERWRATQANEIALAQAMTRYNMTA